MSAAGTAWLAAALLLFASVYLGMGWSLVLFQFPGATRTTRAQDFPDRFGGPVRRAVGFFSVQTLLMVAGSILLTVDQWDQGGRRYLPLAYVVGVAAATAFTVLTILPVNRALYRDVPDEAQFRRLLSRWIRLNVIRVCLWTVEWIAIVAWFIQVSLDGLR
jgi:hypothetical protein